MKIITVPTRLRLTQLQTIAEASTAICRDLAPLQEALAQLEPVLGDFKEGMNKTQAASQREEVDKGRDQALQGLELHLKAELLYEAHSGPVVTALQQLQKIMDKYGNIRYLPLNDETAAIDNLSAELNNFNFAALEGTNLQRWPEKIAAENAEFKAESEKWRDQRVAAEQIESPSNIAPRLRQRLNALYALLAAVHTVSPDDSILKTAYQKINVLVEEVN